ncbi:hypothetical protein E8A66_17965 [Vibrio cholerae]|uniref:Uncharacterized protein n=1 Tax=Vibrio cholerae TaxID=666 RepID=A0A544BP79_VIBCL|nr:hypothetical protein [Vibrio cholerae]EGR0637732.1 hypothetical protein [Vibrio vulnificus]EGR1976114.1 hypothetical protein [Vibrio parahaemolyticus]EHA1127686.1 hypothetical protein [Vibrio navarrensis]EJG0875498.1 hypothetical protein [Vibrio parahaemolyticus O3]EJG0904128.1 hypothetical protein [Vibrio parahaemolyticus O3:K56]EJG1076957.1 hypothetical protein [Vibrio parahaemolyticus O1:K56]KAA3490897.1 hypothetical protein Y058_19680 [Vibrio mimicus]RBM24617.1 hypothetical protein D
MALDVCLCDAFA